jgi:hypothetical protein
MGKDVFAEAVAECEREIEHYRQIAVRLRELEAMIGNLPSISDVRLIFALPSYHGKTTINFALREGRRDSSLPNEMAAALGKDFSVEYWQGYSLVAVFQLDGYRVRIVNWNPSNVRISFESGGKP